MKKKFIPEKMGLSGSGSCLYSKIWVFGVHIYEQFEFSNIQNPPLNYIIDIIFKNNCFFKESPNAYDFF